MTEVVMSQTPPILHGPSEKEKKYDRQLRLWAASGQAALESAHILLVNSGAGTVGIEALKNLVLPGIGKFTIADDAVVNEADLGVNFFLDESCLGKLRSESSAKLLQELNPEVQSDYFPKNGAPLDLRKVLQTSPTFTVILYTYPISRENLGIIEEYGKEHKTPLFAIHSAGFYSYFRINLPGTFPVVDTHPEVEKTTDLRLLSPWPELSQFAEEMTKDIDSLDNHKHGHIPYLVLLLHFLKKWRSSHNGEDPTSTKDKKEFRAFVLSHMRSDNPEGGEENFQEAEAAINKNVVAPRLEDGVKEIFDHQLTNEYENRSTFWLVVAAVKRFYEKNGCLPVPGAIPDMKAESDVYVKLQRIYKNKAQKDAREVFEAVKSMPGGERAEFADVELFCKNARFVRLINATANNKGLDSLIGKSFIAKDAEAEAMFEATGGAFSMPKSNLFIYLALLATAHNPQATADDIMEATHKLAPAVTQNERMLQSAQEVARAQGGELHNISAFTGGMVAQETIKIITKQYIPIDNTCIFDGISSRCQVLHL
ncbi:ThiF family protein [Microdochium trichocladiopsis]|uniref:NEDD8-activating enzyme E1 regulatory subunit n=1 Tax=Microdochium trichocladiopsis TaxID=1682393 RepID=A0A9P8YC54_9PEZI|nr:ThiF family protein [Microdochium trichocladiopsis]KAH7035676.1 ThiF family protein [Microdochium trichocladiopsis]